MIRETHLKTAPYFSICVPQYGRYSFLAEQIRRLSDQSFRSFEMCIADAASPDRRDGEIVELMTRLGLDFRYEWSDAPRPYDPNTRTAIGLARGTYCILMGNDDALATPEVLQDLHDDIEDAGGVGVVLSDFADATTGERARRIQTRFGPAAGPEIAARHFRNFSFVSGVVINRAAAQKAATDRWDGSEMYQTYVGCRLIASGLPLLELERVTVVKDLQIPGETADSFVLRPRIDPCPVVPRLLPLRLLGQVVLDAVRPYASAHDYQHFVRLVMRQLVGFSYPYWLVTYRRVQSWNYSAGLALGMRPRVLLEGTGASRMSRVSTRIVYAAATAGGLFVPDRLFQHAQTRLYAFAKRLRRS